MDNKSFIYMIKNPINNEIRYIGQTRYGKGRFRSHIHEAKTKNRSLPIYNFIRKYLKLGLEPIFEILEYCEKSKLDEREIYWIDYYKRNGFKLLNLTDGGMGHSGYHHTQEARDKISKANSNKKKSKEHVEKVIKSLKEYHKNNPEASLRIANLNKGRIYTPEEIERFKKINKEIVNRPEVRAKLSGINIGRPQSEETRNKRMLSNFKRKRILCIQNNVVYESIRDAAKKLNLASSGICKMLKGLQNNVKGFTFIKVCE